MRTVSFLFTDVTSVYITVPDTEKVLNKCTYID